MRRLAVAAGLALFAATSAPAAEAPGLTIDVPVALKEAKVVFNMDHLAFEGDEPFGFSYMRVMVERFGADKTEWQIVSIFHGLAGYMMLTDETYNKVRKVTTGNPYKAQVEALQKAGIRFEECGLTAGENGWTNADLLPGVAVNTGANFRIIELVQDGFVQIQP
jgi:intracellular sulfur oxidation DsrE/DsrF family protein